jgi:hypothetical protein
MKSTTHLTNSRATRLAAFAIALATVFSTPVAAKSINSNDNASANLRGGSARPAARPSAPARSNTNMSRPAQSASRPAAASRSNMARPNTASATARSSSTRTNASSATARSSSTRTSASSATARSNSTRANTARANSSRPEGQRSNSGRDDHRSFARDGEHAGPGRGDVHGGRDFHNASYSHATNLHGGRQIPEDRFHASFGSAHEFHIGHPVMIGSQASFQFGGFWFGMVDPWPAAWLYSDPVYVDFVNGGYVLVNVAHPDVQLDLSAGDAVNTCNAPAATDDPAPAPTVAVVKAPVTVAYVAPVPVYSYFTWHYWRHYWR